MTQHEMTDEERDFIEERDRNINIDLERIKRDIAETAQRHGFDKATFSIELPDYSASDTPVVNFSGTLVA